VPTPTFDLTTINPHVEVILRAGDIRQKQAREVLQRNYVAANPDYPDVVGLSVLISPGADVLRLVQRNIVPHGRVAHANVEQITTALQRIGYDMVLYITPDLPDLPDHHQLAVGQGGTVSSTLPSTAADVLLVVLQDDLNPNQRKHP
jgi:hypothetical protein